MSEQQVLSVAETGHPPAAPVGTNGFQIKCSSSIAQLVAALAKAQRKFLPAFKSTENPFFESVYADLSSIMEATRDALAEEGLVVTQWPITRDRMAGVVSILAHSSGEWMSYELLVPATGKARRGKGKAGEEEAQPGTEKFDAQTIGSAITYTRRYALQAIIGIAAEVEDDGNGIMRPNTRDAQQAVGDAKVAAAGGLKMESEWFDESQTARITGSQQLLEANRDILKKLWSPTAGAIVATGEQLEDLKYTLEQRKIPFGPKKAK